MIATSRLHIAPIGPALELGRVKEHLRVDHSTEDALIEALIHTATEWVETFTSRALLTQTWDALFDRIPEAGVMRLPKAPVASITHVKYIDTNGVQTTWPTLEWQGDIASAPARIVPAYGYTWPIARQQMHPWEVRYVVGYGDAADVPAGIHQAMLLIIGHWFEHRESVSDFQVFGVPLASEHLLWRYRLPSI
jgi:uncharacterized phiE125 gp8 family phage protein